ncbi:hypothetical protein C2E23DRAFT_863722 [Lenzites betulinus]|nr:hypothetical protein C2E23DRAFT_863722 [Lenzites betulinus]
MFSRAALSLAVAAIAASRCGKSCCFTPWCRAALLTVGMTVAAFAQEPNCARNTTVQLGDTCNSIAAETNTPTFQLLTVNADKIDAACDNLDVGEALCLGIIGHDCDVTHVVVSGDTCEKIATEAGTTFDIILANNPNVNSDCSNIGIGEVLCSANHIIGVNGTQSAA